MAEGRTYKMSMVHKSLFDSCYLYFLIHVSNSVSNDIVILSWYMLGFFCDMFSLLIVACLQRNISWMSWTKNLMRNFINSNVIWLLIWRKKLWMKLRLYWVKKTRKLKFWSHNLLFCRIMWAQWSMPFIKKLMN